MKIGLCSKLIERLMTIKYTTITSIFQYLSEVSNFVQRAIWMRF